MRTLSKVVLNKIGAIAGVRLVNARWGPRGFEAAFRRAHSRGFVPRTVLDIGAFDGRWTRVCRTIFPNAAYFVADPLEENRKALDHLALESGEVFAWHGAIGAQNDQLELNVHADQSSFLSSVDFPGPKRVVPVRTLDSFIEEAGYRAPILLKADVQGFELEVLKGATKCLEMTEVMLLEVSFRRIYDGPLADEVIAFARRQGFRIYDLVSYVQRSTDGELAHADIVLARESSGLFISEKWK